MPLRERDAPGHERVLRRAVDERHALEDRRDHEERLGRHLVVRRLDRAQEVCYRTEPQYLRSDTFIYA